MSNLGTLLVNNQIVASPMSSAYFPSSQQYPYFKGNGQGPATIPLNYMGTSGSGGTTSQASAAASMPFSLTQSPVIWAIIFLIVGVAGLRYIHWRG